MMRVLIVGFGPFPGAPVNPSAVLVKALARRRRPALADIVRATHVFATAYAAVDRDVPKLLAQQPDAVLMFGVAGRRRRLCLETRARNALSVLFPDVRGHRPERTAIVPGGPSELRAPAPSRHMLAAARQGGFPAALSRDAGRYLCNYAYWRMLEQSRGRSRLVQFAHIPLIKMTPRRGGCPPTSFPQLLASAERLLLALIAASRR